MTFNSSQRHLLWSVAVLLLALVLLHPWSGKRSDLRKLWSIDLSELEADVTLEGVRYTRAEEGNPLWVMDADLAKIFEEEGLVNMQKITIYFFQNGENNLIVKADKGAYDTKQKIIKMFGNVRLKSAKGDSLETQVLSLNQKNRLLWSDKYVVIHSQGLVIKGTAFRYYMDEARFEVSNQESVINEGESLTFE